MKRISSLLKLASELALLGILVLLIVLAFRLTGRALDLSPHAGTEYPPPQESPRTLPTEVIASNTPRPTLEPFEATQYFNGSNPSPSDIAAEATFFAEEAIYATQYFLITPLPTPTWVFYPVYSTADLPKVVFNDPFFGNVNNGDFGFCLQANQPGEAVFVKSLDNEGGYYIVPFFKDENVCGLFLVTVEDDLGTAAAGGQGRGTKFPALDAEEAKALIEKNTGKVVSSEPLLAFRAIREVPDPFSPFWVVSTADGQTYYVVGLVGVSSDGFNTEKLITHIWNSSEVHPINP
ncbi:MAG: hypothetical protein A2136_08455 [Chloroflexi bacterium RBG_16_54_11]|nr:MAG: hypothetical protein A2136_08455 [Chloroflexi bacterium RBG_16_54_11]